MATSLGNSAVPGATWPGAGWPGQPLGAVVITGYLFGGPETLVYPSYIDVNAQHTLVAEPSGTYLMSSPSPALDQSIPPADGFWTAG